MQIVQDPIRRQEILDAYFGYFKAYVARDWGAMVSRLDPDMTMFGTGIDEVGLTREASLGIFAREFEQAPGHMTYRVKTSEIYSITPEVVLVVLVMDMDYVLDDTVLKSDDNRTSAVMVDSGAGWVLAHAHWSQPDMEQDRGESMPFKQLLDENRRLENLVAQRTEDLRRTNSELTEALANVKTLKGILPICSHCKKIRNDTGYWTQIERYISHYTDAFFSHSVCPECLEKHYARELSHFQAGQKKSDEEGA